MNFKFFTPAVFVALCATQASYVQKLILTKVGVIKNKSLVVFKEKPLYFCESDTHKNNFYGRVTFNNN